MSDTCRIHEPEISWRHQMETFSALLAMCAGNSPVPGEFPTQRPVTRSFDVFFHLLPNKRLSKHWWGWWFETPSRPLRRHSNVMCSNGLELLVHCWSIVKGIIHLSPTQRASNAESIVNMLAFSYTKLFGTCSAFINSDTFGCIGEIYQYPM